MVAESKQFHHFDLTARGVTVYRDLVSENLQQKRPAAQWSIFDQLIANREKKSQFVFLAIRLRSLFAKYYGFSRSHMTEAIETVKLVSYRGFISGQTVVRSRV